MLVKNNYVQNNIVLEKNHFQCASIDLEAKNSVKNDIYIGNVWKSGFHHYSIILG